MHRESVRELAIQLRTKGYSYPYISGKTGLSKSTLSGWLSEVPYTPNIETVRAYGNARAAATERKAKIRQKQMEELRREAAKTIGKIGERDLFLFGLGLYLGEGCKSNGQVRIVNSDPKLIRAAVEWFLFLGVRKNQFAARVHLYPDSDIKGCLQFWSKTTRIPVSQFLKVQIDRRTDKKTKKAGKLPYGTLDLAVRSKGRKEYGVEFFRKIQTWNENVLSSINNAGIV